MIFLGLYGPRVLIFQYTLEKPGPDVSVLTGD